MDQVADQGVHRLALAAPRPGHAPERQALGDPALLAHHAAHLEQVIGEALHAFRHRVERDSDAAGVALPVGREPAGEIALLERRQRGEQLLDVEWSEVRTPSAGWGSRVRPRRPGPRKRAAPPGVSRGSRSTSSEANSVGQQSPNQRKRHAILNVHSDRGFRRGHPMEESGKKGMDEATNPENRTHVPDGDSFERSGNGDPVSRGRDNGTPGRAPGSPAPEAGGAAPTPSGSARTPGSCRSGWRPPPFGRRAARTTRC